MNSGRFEPIDAFGLFGITVFVQVTLVLAFAIPLIVLSRRSPAVTHALCLGCLALCAMSPLVASPSWFETTSWLTLNLNLPQPMLGASERPEIRSMQRSGSRASESTRPLDKDGHEVSPPNPSVAPLQTPAPVDTKFQVDNNTGSELAQPLDGPLRMPRAGSAVPARTAEEPGPSARFVATTVPDDARSELASATAGNRSWLRPGIRALIAVWALGLVFLGTRFVVRLRRLKRLINTARQVHDERVRELLQNVCREIGLNRTPLLLSGPAHSIPFVAGILRPRLVLPGFLLVPMRRAMLRDVLIHECSHIRRHDPLVGLLQRGIVSVYWLHPLAQLVSRFLSRSREELCDNHVLERTSATAYANTLLELSKCIFNSAVPAQAFAAFSRRRTLESRIAGFLDEKRNGNTRLTKRSVAGLSLAFLAAGLAVSRIEVASGPPQTAAAAVDDQPADSVRDPEALAKEVLRRAAYWTGERDPDLKTLQYTFLLSHEAQAVKLTRGVTPSTYRHWQGTTLSSGIRALARDPDQFTFSIERRSGETDNSSIRLVCRVKDPDQLLKITLGNGIDGRWRGYFSHRAREVVLDIDAEKLVPIRERAGPTVLKYGDWQHIGDDRWVPGLISIRRQGIAWNQHFEWVGDAVWLLQYAEIDARHSKEIVARTRDVVVNGTPAQRSLTERERRSDKNARIVRTMLAHNQPWLGEGLSGLDSIEFTFHTVREDVQETCYVDKDGLAIFEVVHDGKHKMNGVGDRRMSLPSEETARTHRSLEFAMISPRPERSDDQPFDLSLRHYARIGCRFDLPVFRFSERIETAGIDVEPGEWQGRPCDVIRVANLGRDVYLGAGTMLGFSSWSYVHHVRPAFELLYIDRERHVPLHETLSSGRDGRTFEIDYADWVEVRAGEWAPLSIRVEADNYFTCEYRFQLIGGRHWILKDVISRFDSEDESRGVVGNIRVNQPFEIRESALRQIAATRELLAGANAPAEGQTLTAAPIEFGRWTAIGPYRVLLTLTNPCTMGVQIETEQETAQTSVPLLLFEEDTQPVAAVHVPLDRRDTRWSGEASLGTNHALAGVKLIAIPGAVNEGSKVECAVTRVQWNHTQKCNVADVRGGKTRATQFRITQAQNGAARAKVFVVSIDGMQEFQLDASVALFDRSGRLVAGGSGRQNLRVVSTPATSEIEVDLGRIAEPDAVATALIAVTPGQVVARPLLSKWSRYPLQAMPVAIAQLLGADVPACWRAALERLTDSDSRESIEREFFNGDRDRNRLIDGKQSRNDILKPHAPLLVRILEKDPEPQILAETCRLLGHSGEAQHADRVRPLLLHEEPLVQDAAAVGLGLLRDDSLVDRLRPILERIQPDATGNRDAFRAYSRLETDTLIALTTVASDEAVDVLGTTLLQDLSGTTIEVDAKGRQFLAGRPDRAQRIAALLGWIKNRRSVDWLAKAVAVLDEHPEQAGLFDQRAIARSLLQSEELARDIIVNQIRQSDYSYLRVLSESRNPRYIDAVGDMMLSEATTAGTFYQGVSYLWNVGTPEAVAVLRAAHAAGRPDDAGARMHLGEALAALGDDRGLQDAFRVLVSAYAETEPPADEKVRRTWDRDRKRQEEAALDVFGRVTQESIERFVEPRLAADDRATRLAVLKVIESLEEHTRLIQSTLEKWADSPDEEIAKEARRRLEESQ